MVKKTGNSGANVLKGTSASDLLRGLAGDDTLAGAAGNDTLSGGAGDDALNGGDGNDLLAPGTGSDSVDGGKGNDTITFAGEAEAVRVRLDSTYSQYILDGYKTITNVDNIIGTSFGDTLSGDSRANTIRGEAGSDTLSGGDGNDTLRGGTGNDTISGDGGRNKLFGEAGDDIFLDTYNSKDTADGGAGNDTFKALYGGDKFIGGAGSDTLSFESSYYGVKATVNGKAVWGYSNAYTMTSSQIENLTGSNAGDTLNGSSGANILDGRSGDDILRGNGGSDTLIGGLGKNVLAGGAGVDAASYADATAGVKVSLAKTGFQATGGAGTDRLTEIENLIGSAFNDRLTGNGRANILTGGLGNDVLNGGGGRDTADYSDIGTGVTVNLGATGPQATGGAGRDTLVSIERVAGTDFADTLIGNRGANDLLGGAGNDMLQGKAGDDLLNGGSGFDIASYAEVTTKLNLSLAKTGAQKAGSAGADKLVSIEGLAGGSASDKLAGNKGDNILIGNGGADTLSGGDGNDTLRGGAGNDVLNGQAGRDTADYSDIGKAVTVHLAKTGIQNTGGAGRDMLVGIENVTGSKGNDKLFGDTRGNVIDGGGGSDRLFGGQGSDTLIGGAGNDILDAGNGTRERLIGGSGNDRYMLGTGKGTGIIEDSLGSHDLVDASQSRDAATINLSTGKSSTSGGQTLTLASGGSSTLPLDLMFLQDLSGSFGDDIEQVRTLVPKVVKAINGVNSDSAYGVVGFVDKPISPFGSSYGDYVYELFTPITKVGSRISDAYSEMTIKSGADGDEAQLETLFQVAKRAEGEVGFRDGTMRVAIIFTDAGYHEAGDGASAGITKPNDGDADIEGNGILEDYPSVTQLSKALAASGIFPIFAVTSGTTTTYDSLVDELGVGGVVSLQTDSSNIVSVIKNATVLATQTAIEDAIGSRFNDRIIGSAIENIISGGKGDDTISGLDGDDVLRGGEGRDTIKGGDGNDMILGEGGNDALNGGAGDDTLRGGTGADKIIGGDGGDTFVFKAVSESTLNASRRDTISDFSGYEGDVIDLTGIDAHTGAKGNQAFDFIGTSDFSGTAGELRYELRNGTDALVQGDVDGDGTADFGLLLKDVTYLYSSYFHL